MNISVLFKKYVTSKLDRLIAVIFVLMALLGLTLTLVGCGSFVTQASMVALPSLLYLASSWRGKAIEIQPANFELMPLLRVSKLFPNTFSNYHFLPMDR